MGEGLSTTFAYKMLVACPTDELVDPDWATMPLT
jgi:hypothetical protein